MIIDTLLFLIIGTVLISLYKLIVKPLIPIIKLKLQFRSYALIYFWPLFGDFKYLKDSLRIYNDALFMKRQKLHNSNYKFRLTNYFSNFVLHVLDPEYYKIMMINHEKYEKVNVLKHSQLMTQGLVFSNGEKWKRQRQLLGNPFKYDQLKSRLPMMNQIVKSKLQSVQGTDVIRLMSSITGEVVIKSFFGEESLGFQLNGHEAQIEISNLMNSIGALRFSSYYYLVKHTIFGQKAWHIFPTNEEKDLSYRFENVRKEIRNLIQSRIQKIQNSQCTGDDYLGVYLGEYLNQKPEGGQITIEEIIQQFLTLFFAGTDTTALLCSICLYYFALYPEIQDEIREEILLLGDQDILEGQLTKLIKLSAFINEVLRIRNPASRLLMRKCNQTHYVKDLKIEKGWLIAIENNQSGLHDDHFDNASDFNYKRWLNEKAPIKEDNNFIFVPFSAGGRNCIGQHMALMEAKIILVHLLRSFKMKINTNVQVSWSVKVLYQFSPGNAVILEKYS